MSHSKEITHQLVLGWLVAAVVIFIIPFVLVPETNRSSYFLFRILWTEALSSLVWLSIGFYTFVATNRDATTTGLGGISPTFFVVSGSYAIVSFLLMAVHAYIPPLDLADRVHLVLQILLFAGVFIVGVFLVVSCFGASAGGMLGKHWISTPKALHDMIFSVESSIQNPASEGMKEYLKNLREGILFSINESESLTESVIYQDFCSEIKEFCKMAQDQIEEATKEEQGFAELEKRAIGLLSKTRVVAENLVRR